MVNMIEELGRELPIKKLSRDPIGLVYHHEGSPSAEGSSVHGIANYHTNLVPNGDGTTGWGKIGYHFIIGRDGLLYQTLDLDERGFHAGLVRGEDINAFPNKDSQYYNDSYLAVCIVGNDPTTAQMETMIKLGVAVTKAGAKSLLSHKELPGKKTECPGYAFSMDWIRQEVRDRIAAEQKPQPQGTGPGSGDDEFARQYKTWKEAYVNAKGVADDLGQKHIQVLTQARSLRLKLDAAQGQLESLVQFLERITAK